MAETFALGSPRAYQPSYAESSILSSMLGKLNGNDASRLGMMLLGNYQGERAAAESGYDQQVQKQNQFAYQQLQQQIANEKAKNAIELFGKPEGATMVAGTPSLQQAIGQDVSPNVTLGAAQTLRAGELAKTLQAAGIGAYNAAEAGVPTNAASVGALLPGMQFSNQAPLSIQKELIAQQGANNRAALNAANSAITEHVDFGKTDTGAPIGGISYKTRGETADQIRQRMTAEANARSGASGGQTYGSPGSVSGPSAPTGSAAPASVPPDVQAAANNKLNDLSRSSNPIDRQKYLDIRGATAGGGGNVPVVRRPDGRYVVVGKSGNQYE